MVRTTVAIFAAAAALAAAASQPNIVVLFADDLGYGDVGFNGNPTVSTPNLDKLAFQGVRFSSWYSAAPICTPSRAGLMTGRYPARFGLAGDHHTDTSKWAEGPGVFGCSAEYGLPTNETTLAQELKGAGYETGMFGKWHLGQQAQYLPNNRGFDEYFGVPYSDDMGASYFQGRYNPYPNANCPPIPLFNNSGPGSYNIIEQPAIFDTLAERYAAFATDFITRKAKGSSPFFLYAAFSHVHVAVPGDEQWAGAKFWNTSLRGPFGDATTEMDWIAGQIIDTIDNLGIGEDTVIFFTSDNGPWRSKQLFGGSQGIFSGDYAATQYGYSDSGKGSTWEAGLREPAAARWTGHTIPGSVSSEIHSTMDIFATSLSLAGIARPSNRIIDGQDISSVLMGNGDSGWGFYVYFRNADIWAVRYGGWKAHYATKSGFGDDHVVFHNPPLVFNVDHDPSENYPIDVSTIPDVMASIASTKADFEAKLYYAPDLLNPSGDQYWVCCNHTLACNCTTPPSYPGTPASSTPHWYPIDAALKELRDH